MKNEFRAIDKIFLLAFVGMAGMAFLLYGLFGRTIPEVRPLMAAYLGNPLEAPEIWLTSLDGNSQQQLTHTQGKIYEFSAAPDGESLVYSLLNADGGTDLYRIDRKEKTPVRLVQCGQAHCEQFVWQPNGSLAAYTKFVRGLQVDATINLIDLETGDSHEIPGGAALDGAYPTFSPDGRTLAFFDITVGGIRLIDLETGSEKRVPSGEPQLVSWSGDGREIFFKQSVLNGLLTQSRLYRYDLSTQQVKPFLPDELSGYDASRIEWSPDGAWGVFGLTDSDIQSGQQLYIVRKDGTDLQAITRETGTSHAAYHWSPSGDQIIFQRYQAGMLDARPQIVQWDRNANTIRVLSEIGAMPAWLP